MRHPIFTLFLAAYVSLLSACSALDRKEEDETLGWSAAKLYETAREQLGIENYKTAIELYEKLETRHPFGQFAQQALLESAYAQHKDNEPDAAIAAADRFIKLYPRHPSVDYAHYLKGLANFDRNFGFFQRYIPTDRSQRDQAASLQAFNDFSELVTLHPDSIYAADARQRMVYLRNNVAAYDVHVGRYYIKRGAYLAAANRGRNVVENFPQATATADALAIMLVSYTLMGLAELATDTRRVLEANYPRHPVLQGPISQDSDTGRVDKWYQFWN